MQTSVRFAVLSATTCDAGDAGEAAEAAEAGAVGELGQGGEAGEANSTFSLTDSDTLSSYFTQARERTNQSRSTRRQRHIRRRRARVRLPQPPQHPQHSTNLEEHGPRSPPPPSSLSVTPPCSRFVLLSRLAIPSSTRPASLCDHLPVEWFRQRRVLHVACGDGQLTLALSRWLDGVDAAASTVSSSIASPSLAPAASVRPLMQSIVGIDSDPMYTQRCIHHLVQTTQREMMARARAQAATTASSPPSHAPISFVCAHAGGARASAGTISIAPQSSGQQYPAWRAPWLFDVIIAPDVCTEAAPQCPATSQRRQHDVDSRALVERLVPLLATSSDARIILCRERTNAAAAAAAADVGEAAVITSSCVVELVHADSMGAPACAQTRDEDLNAAAASTTKGRSRRRRHETISRETIRRLLRDPHFVPGVKGMPLPRQCAILHRTLEQQAQEQVRTRSDTRRLKRQLSSRLSRNAAGSPIDRRHVIVQQILRHAIPRSVRKKATRIRNQARRDAAKKLSTKTAAIPPAV